jgi:hypothetical protein
MRKARQKRPDKRPVRSVPRWLPPAGTGLAVAAAVLILATRGPGGGQVAWASLRTQDVHSLAFVGGDPEHVLFGHHGGLLESRDGG